MVLENIHRNLQGFIKFIILLMVSGLYAQGEYIQGPTTVNQGDILTYTALDPYNEGIHLGSTYWTWYSNNDIDDATASTVDIEFVDAEQYTIDIEFYDVAGNYIAYDYLYVDVIPEQPNTPPNPTVQSSVTGSVTLERTGTPPSGVIWYWQSSSSGASTSNGSEATKVVTSGTTHYLRAYNAHSGLWSTGSGSVSYTVPTLQTWYQDSDGDGLGDPNSSVTQSSQPTGYVGNSDDQCPILTGTAANNGCPAFGCTPSDENYVHNITPTEGTNNLGTLSNEQLIESISYYDGLGRPMQSVAVRAGGQQQDIVTHIEYDEYGRQVKGYLPYAMTSSCGQYQNNALTATNTFYNTTKYENTLNPFSEKYFEASPLNRVIEQAAPGDDWKLNETADTDPNNDDSDHTIKFGYAANTSNEVIYFDTEFVGGDTEKPKLVLTNTHYNEGELYKTITKDENWRTSEKKDRTTEEFKDKQGRVVLKRTYNNQQPHDTNYVYDDYGNLTYVLPPLASQKAVFYNLTPTIVNLNQLVSGGSPTGSISISIEKTGTNTYQLVGDIDLHNLGNSTFIKGEIIDIPNLDPSLGSYINLGGISQFDYINNIDYYRGVYYYILNGKLYCHSYSYTYNWDTDEETEGVSGANFPDITDIDNTKTLGLPDTLEGITEVETQANVQEVLDKLCYQYKYDNRNRLIEKKIPGKVWEYIVYDKLDRPVLTQDANLRADNKWLFTKYDVFGRVVYTGIYTHASLQDQNQMQGNLDAFYTTNTSNNLYESKQNAEGSYHYYSNQSFPNANMEILTVNYYDDYSFNTEGQSLPSSWDGQDIINHNNSSSTKKLTKGLATGSQVKVLEQPNWITTVTGYDAKARPIYVMSKNTYLGTSDVVKNTLDFTGAVDKTVTEHNKGTTNIITEDVFTYDHMGRLAKQTQELNNTNALEVIAENHYDELGQLESKGLGGSNTNTNRLQNVDYTYNIRGWLKTINDPFQALGTDLFSMKLSYNNDAGTRLYNGNISEQTWKTANDNISRTYGYRYDDLNRITNAYIGPLWISTFQVQNIIYDKNGNIQALHRNGAIVENPSIDNPSDYGTMDDLTYSYDGNQLLSVTDSGNTTYGFKDGNTSGADYTYDANGNMLRDLNKGISSNITYNHLNLPKQVTLSGGNISYIYDATGVKLKKVVSTGATTEYAGNYVYENSSLKFFNHPEGYVDTSSGYKYVYQYKDHLGNVRLSYQDTNGNYKQILDSDFESSFDGWEQNGSVNYTLDNGRLKANVNSSWEGVRHYLNDFTVNPGETYNIKLEFDKGNTQAPVRLYIQELDANGNHLSWNVINSNLETGNYNYNYTVNSGNRLVLRIDKNNTYTSTETYFYIDHASLTRGSLEILEENNYYPFGLEHKGYNKDNILSTNIALKRKFGGKEYQDELGLGWYDITARNYDPALGRWMNLDPLAEQMRRHSPYNYAFNNPIFFIDYDGMEPCPNGEDCYDDGTYVNTTSATVIGENAVNELDEVVIGTVTSSNAQGLHAEGNRVNGYKIEGEIRTQNTKTSGSLSGFSAGYENTTEGNMWSGNASVYGAEAEFSSEMDGVTETKGKASLFKAEASGAFGVYSPEVSDGKQGVAIKANAGAYVAKAELSTSITIPESIPLLGGIKIGVTRGVSFASAHIGGGVEASAVDGVGTLRASANIGFGVGVKYGFSFSTAKLK